MSGIEEAPDAWRKWQEELRWSAEHALEYPPEGLLAYSCAVVPGSRRAFLKAHFSQAPSEDAIDAIQAVESEVAAYLPDDFELETEVEVVPAGSAPRLLPALAFAAPPAA
ncbi:hypothetical protein [Roseomonas sp. 18066]|uniref:hypothetical protein n=1 Tax=Roseomonas sp. 18066 TaxID=2681412 RepID=UPI001356E763|nr:hypothetical protein [Roseomonas sp. 18066]